MTIQTISAVMMNFSTIFSSTFLHNMKKKPYDSCTYPIRGDYHQSAYYIRIPVNVFDLQKINVKRAGILFDTKNS